MKKVCSASNGVGIASDNCDISVFEIDALTDRILLLDKGVILDDISKKDIKKHYKNVSGYMTHYFVEGKKPIKRKGKK